MQYVEQVTCHFLIVGHTGNECDQTFSVLANEFKKEEMLTIEVLKERILNAPLVPKPICRSLDFVYDWKSFITPRLSERPLSNHSKYFCFNFVIESGQVKFRGKLLPQLPDSYFVPRSGIRLIREGADFLPIGVADFRVSDIKFDDIMKSLSKYTEKLPLQQRMAVNSSWERHRKHLEDLPSKIRQYPLMKLDDLPVQVVVQVDEVPDYLADEEEVAELRGDIYEEDVPEGNLADIGVGADVCVYTEDKVSRPWVGRITQVLNQQSLEIHWFSRKTPRGKTFSALNKPDGSPYLSVLEKDSIMFWHMSEKRTETEFSLSSYWIEVISNEYRELDK